MSAGSGVGGAAGGPERLDLERLAAAGGVGPAAAPEADSGTAEAGEVVRDVERMAASGQAGALAVMARLLDALDGGNGGRPEAAGAPAAAPTPPEGLDETREKYLADLRADRNWQRLPDEVKAKLEGIVRDDVDLKLLKWLKALIGDPDVVLLASGNQAAKDVLLQLADIAARNPTPEALAKLNASVPHVLKLLQSDGFEEAPAKVREQVVRLLAEDPDAARERRVWVDGRSVDVSLLGLLNNPGFQRMSRSKKAELLEGAADSEKTAAEAIEKISAAVVERTGRAEQKAAAMAKLLEGDYGKITDEEAKLVGFSSAKELVEAILQAGMSTPSSDWPRRRAIVNALKGEDAGETLAAFTKDHAGYENALYDMLPTSSTGPTRPPRPTRARSSWRS